MNSQVLQHLSIPEALSDVHVGNSIGFGNIPDSSISSSGNLQVLLELLDSMGSTVLIFRVTGRSPGNEVRFQNFWSEVVIPVVTRWVISVFLGGGFSCFTQNRASQVGVT